MMKQRAKSLGLHVHSFDAFIFSKYKEEVMSVYDMLSDQNSRNIYSELIDCRINGYYKAGLSVSNQYYCFDAFSNVDIGRSFVDCGAYVGDTVERYLWNRDGLVDSILAFEPDSDNRHALQKRMRRLCEEWNLSKDAIQIIPAGVSDHSDKLLFSHGEESSSSIFVNNGKEEVVTVALDDVITYPVSLIKADIESYEYRMLQGARKTIESYHPSLAIAIYHSSIDFFSIPKLIKQICPAYHLAVRHHGCRLSETDVYAWIE